MNFTGSQLMVKRNFYTQNENFGVVVDFSLDDPSGRYEFGASGLSNVSLVFESGQIKFNNLFIQTYKPFNEYSILMEVSTTGVNIIKDDYEICYGLTKNSGDYNYFYFNRANTGMGAEFDFTLSGQNLPNYSISNRGFWFNSGQTVVSGLFTNLGSYPIKVFNSVAQGKQNLTYFFITGNVGEMNYTGDFTQFDFAQPVKTSFFTNFGEASVNFQIFDTTTLSRFVVLDEITDFSFNTDNQINRELGYINYSGGLAVDNFNTDIFFKLEYIDGSGDFYVNDFANSAEFISIGYGRFLQSGILTGQSVIQTGNSNVTGQYIVNFSRFKWATGPATGFFSGNGTGLASGINYTGLAYGAFTGLATGFINDGSGT